MGCSKVCWKLSDHIPPSVFFVHRLFRDLLRPSRFYRFQVWCLGNGWCFQMCWLENFCRWSYSSFSEDFALLILNQSWDIFALTPTRGLDEGNQILEFWRLRIDGWVLGVGLVEFLWPKKTLPKPWRLNQGADVLCFVELDCYHECGIRQVIFLVQCWPSWEKNPGLKRFLEQMVMM